MIEFNRYGERLIGCIDCNCWRGGKSAFIVDIQALRKNRQTRSVRRWRARTRHQPILLMPDSARTPMTLDSAKMDARRAALGVRLLRAGTRGTIAMTTFGGVPVKTRLPVSVWAFAALVTFFSLVSSLIGTGGTEHVYQASMTQVLRFYTCSSYRGLEPDA